MVEPRLRGGDRQRPADDLRLHEEDVLDARRGRRVVRLVDDVQVAGQAWHRLRHRGVDLVGVVQVGQHAGRQQGRRRPGLALVVRADRPDALRQRRRQVVQVAGEHQIDFVLERDEPRLTRAEDLVGAQRVHRDRRVPRVAAVAGPAHAQRRGALRVAVEVRDVGDLRGRHGAERAGGQAVLRSRHAPAAPAVQVDVDVVVGQAELAARQRRGRRQRGLGQRRGRDERQEEQREMVVFHGWRGSMLRTRTTVRRCENLS